jgi:hypothetical protein
MEKGFETEQDTKSDSRRYLSDIEKQNFSSLVFQITSRLNDHIKQGMELKKRFEDYKKENGREDVDTTLTLLDTLKEFLIFRDLFKEGVVTDDDFNAISSSLLELVEYEVGRIEARAKAYSDGYGKDTESRREAILQGSDSTHSKALLSLLKLDMATA